MRIEKEENLVKTGRPKIKDPSTKLVTVRFTEEEYLELKKYIKSHNLSLTQAVKKGLTLLYKEQ